MHSATRSWTINGDFLALPPNGVARYAREVTAALDALVEDGGPVVRDVAIEIVSPCVPREPLPLKAIPLRVVREYSRPRLPQFWVQAQLPWHVRGGLLSFCNLGPIAVSKQIVCIHDLQTRLVPDSYGRGFRFAHRVLLPLLGRRCAGITTVSEFSRDHLIAFEVAPGRKIVVTCNGHEHALRWDAQRSPLHLRPDRPYVLVLGRRHRHKNNELIGRLAGPLDRIGIDILVAGDMRREELFGHGSGPSNVSILGRISDDDFAKALDRALCFLLPSRIEGFGLPALEAMARGCPTVVSQAASLPEVCGDAALYAAPDALDEWVTAIGRIHDDHALRETLRTRGPARARRFSWHAIAETYLAMMAAIDARAPIPGRETGPAYVEPLEPKGVR